MKIKEVKIDNILSFYNFELKLNEKNIIIGTNGTGKSNFLDLIQKSLNYNYFNNDDREKYLSQHNSEIMLSIYFDSNEINNILDLVLMKYYIYIIINTPEDQRQYIANQINSTNFKTCRDKVNEKTFSIFELRLKSNNYYIQQKNNNSIFKNKNFDNILLEVNNILQPDKNIIKFNYSNSFDEKLFHNNQYAYELFNKYRNNNIKPNDFNKYGSINSIDKYLLNEIQKKTRYIDNYNGQDCAKDLLGIKNKQDLLDKRFTIIKEKFKNIINRDIEVTDDKGGAYLYLIMGNSKYKNLSKGENELIYVLTELYKDNNNIVLIDEPVTGLSHENKKKFREVVLENNDNNISQYILITHNQDLISEKNILMNDNSLNAKKCNNIIRFQMEYNRTVGKSLKDFFCKISNIHNEKIKKEKVDELKKELTSLNKEMHKKLSKKKKLKIKKKKKEKTEKFVNFFNNEHKLEFNNEIKKKIEITMKFLFENKQIFFSDKCLLVEGAHDYKFMTSYFQYLKEKNNGKHYDESNYNIVIVQADGKDKIQYLIEPLNYFKIKTKCIFDFDMFKCPTNRKELKMDKYEEFITKKFDIDMITCLAKKKRLEMDMYINLVNDEPENFNILKEFILALIPEFHTTHLSSEEFKKKKRKRKKKY